MTVPNLEPTTSPWKEAIGLAQRLPKERFDLTVCSLRPDGVEESRPLLQRCGVKVIVARFRPRGRSLGHMIQALRDGRILRSEEPFDLQHSMDFTASPFEALMSRRHSRRFMFTQRNMGESGSRAALWLKSRFACRVVCVSDAARSLLLELRSGPSPTTIYPGIDVDSIPWRPPSLGPGASCRLLMVAHIARRKGIETALESLRLLSSAVAGVHLNIAGRVDDPVYHRDLLEYAESLGVRRNVAFLGPRSDVFELMKEADVLLHTAESEAFGLVIIEAMAIGLPVVAPRMQGPSEIIEHDVSGILVNPGEAKGYSEAIQALCSKPDFARELSVCGRQRVAERFTARRMAEELTSVYEAACR